ncbi:hypothetical protein KC717_03535 [Candidatus Dojkabacteria bacterium]|uniref:Uncharacterized protein n=1 Tax=Candidatus Dojkabacteria bacterium TaxID=2099670 RepID=A0A955L8K2_9BACT|nr:hypothetical protein [Candidatus Dojkabacteria bacterium]
MAKSKAKKPNPFTTVTPLSRLIALILFVSLPIISLIIGIGIGKSCGL